MSNVWELGIGKEVAAMAKVQQVPIFCIWPERVWSTGMVYGTLITSFGSELGGVFRG